MVKGLRRGFSLIELLIILAIITILAGFLFPVLAKARESARGAVCISNFKQVGAATMLYLADYNDQFTPVNQQLVDVPNSRNDRTWVQLLLPYSRNFNSFFCPSADRSEPAVESGFDADLVAGDTTTRYYRASQHVNFGYNYQYLSPVVRNRDIWEARPVTLASLSRPSDTLMFLDSAGPEESGRGLVRGGSWLVVPPCRFRADGTDTFTNSREPIEISTINYGWEDGESPFLYGGAWPWHSAGITVGMADGHARSYSLGKLAAGCDVQANWQGVITNQGEYAWDIR